MKYHRDSRLVSAVKKREGIVREILLNPSGTSSVLVIEREDGVRVLKLATEVSPVK